MGGGVLPVTFEVENGCSMLNSSVMGPVAVALLSRPVCRASSAMHRRLVGPRCCFAGDLRRSLL